MAAKCQADALTAPGAGESLVALDLNVPAADAGDAMVKRQADAGAGGSPEPLRAGWRTFVATPTGRCVVPLRVEPDVP